MHALNAAHGGGRPRALSADACLAMALYYLRTENHLLAPALIFGVVESMVCSQRGPRACDFELNASAFSHLQVSKYTTAGLVVLQAVLDGCPEAAVAWPSDADLTVYADAMKARCPALPYGGALTMDGVFFYGASSGDVRQQNRSYSGARVSANVRVRAGHLSAPAACDRVQLLDGHARANRASTYLPARLCTRRSMYLERGATRRSRSRRACTTSFGRCRARLSLLATARSARQTGTSEARLHSSRVFRRPQPLFVRMRCVCGVCHRRALCVYKRWRFCRQSCTSGSRSSGATNRCRGPSGGSTRAPRT